MTTEEIIQKVIDYLDLQLNSAMESIHQEPSKSAFFALFAEAYHQGFMVDRSLTADALLDILNAEWFLDEHGKNAERLACVEPLLFYWHTWRYAWDRCDQKKSMA
jgi:hypothetical protein